MKLSSTKIETFTHVWNPVWGCKNNCPYCYARGIAKRFAAVIAQREIEYKKQFSGWIIDDSALEHLTKKLQNFEPTFLYSAMNIQFPKKPAHIFVGSMSDIGYWTASQIQIVMMRIAEQEKHRFYFLSKNPTSYKLFPAGVWMRDIPKNVWKGITVSSGIEFKQKMADLKYYNIAIDWVSIEPLLGEFDDEALALLRDVDWVVVGAMTGPLAEKNQPELYSVNRIADFCKSNLIDVFVKSNFLNYTIINLVSKWHKQIPQLMVGKPSGSF